VENYAIVDTGRKLAILDTALIYRFCELGLSLLG